MNNWPEIKNNLETEVIVKSLRGRISFQLVSGKTEYIALCLDGRDVKEGAFYDFYRKSHLMPENPQYHWNILSDLRDEGVQNPGLCEAWEFEEGWKEFCSNSPMENIATGELIPMLLAILDDRFSRGELILINRRLLRWAPMLQYVYWLRTEAEGLQIPYKLIR